MRSVTLALLLVALIAIPVFDQAQAKDKGWDDWKFGLGLYLPLLGVSGDVSMATPSGGSEELPIDMDFRDLTENWGGGIAGIFNLKKERWSVNLDMLYQKFDSDQSIPGLINESIKVNTEVSISEYELFLGYQISDPDEGVSEIIFGTRYIGQSFKLAAGVEETSFSETGVDVEVSENWWMGFIGARHVGPLGGSEKWRLIIRADMGAFDTSGRLTWRADLGTDWHFADHWDLVLKYKWLGVDYKKGQPGDSDYYYYKANEHGPVIGIGVRF